MATITRTSGKSISGVDGIELRFDGYAIPKAEKDYIKSKLGYRWSKNQAMWYAAYTPERAKATVKAFETGKINDSLKLNTGKVFVPEKAKAAAKSAVKTAKATKTETKATPKTAKPKTTKKAEPKAEPTMADLLKAIDLLNKKIAKLEAAR